MAYPRESVPGRAKHGWEDMMTPAPAHSRSSTGTVKKQRVSFARVETRTFDRELKDGDEVETRSISPLNASSILSGETGEKASDARSGEDPLEPEYPDVEKLCQTPRDPASSRRKLSSEFTSATRPHEAGADKLSLSGDLDPGATSELAFPRRGTLSPGGVSVKSMASSAAGSELREDGWDDFETFKEDGDQADLCDGETDTDTSLAGDTRMMSFDAGVEAARQGTTPERLRQQAGQTGLDEGTVDMSAFQRHGVSGGPSTPELMRRNEAMQGIPEREPVQFDAGRASHPAPRALDMDRPAEALGGILGGHLLSPTQQRHEFQQKPRSPDFGSQRHVDKRPFASAGTSRSPQFASKGTSRSPQYASIGAGRSPQYASGARSRSPAGIGGVRTPDRERASNLAAHLTQSVDGGPFGHRSSLQLGARRSSPTVSLRVPGQSPTIPWEQPCAPGAYVQVPQLPFHQQGRDASAVEQGKLEEVREKLRNGDYERLAFDDFAHWIDMPINPPSMPPRRARRQIEMHEESNSAVTQAKKDHAEKMRAELEDLLTVARQKLVEQEQEQKVFERSWAQSQDVLVSEAEFVKAMNESTTDTLKYNTKVCRQHARAQAASRWREKFEDILLAKEIAILQESMVAIRTTADAAKNQVAMTKDMRRNVASLQFSEQFEIDIANAELLRLDEKERQSVLQDQAEADEAEITADEEASLQPFESELAIAEAATAETAKAREQVCQRREECDAELEDESRKLAALQGRRKQSSVKMKSNTNHVTYTFCKTKLNGTGPALAVAGLSVEESKSTRANSTLKFRILSSQADGASKMRQSCNTLRNQLLRHAWERCVTEVAEADGAMQQEQQPRDASSPDGAMKVEVRTDCVSLVVEKLRFAIPLVMDVLRYHRELIKETSLCVDDCTAKFEGGRGRPGAELLVELGLWVPFSHVFAQGRGGLEPIVPEGANAAKLDCESCQLRVPCALRTFPEVSWDQVSVPKELGIKRGVAQTVQELLQGAPGRSTPLAELCSAVVEAMRTRSPRT